MKNVLIAGYFGFGNAGDELILNSIIENVRKEKAGAKITVLSNSPLETALLYGVTAVSRWNLPGVARSIKACDVFISAGGLYQDKTGNLSLYYYLSLILTARFFRKRIFLYGVEFAPIKHSINKLMIKFVMGFIDKIGVRSQGSMDFLKGIGVEKNVFLSADALLLMDTLPAKKQNPDSPSDKPPDRPRKIAMILKKSTPYHRDLLAQLCSALYNRFSAEIYFVPFHLDRDVHFCIDVANKLNFPTLIEVFNKPSDLFGILSDMDLVVSQRLHGLILSSLLKIPMFGISSDPKLGFFSSEIDQRHIVMEQFDIITVVELINDVWKWRKEFISALEQKIDKLRYRSYLNVTNLVSMAEWEGQ
ncbi:MAG: polysaccharide pyruvyl transferase CsaB [Elusimicrobiota bacterium]